MAGWKKLLLGSVVVGGVLLITVFLLVKIYVTPERVHRLVQSGLEESLQRKVSLGGVDVGLFSGIQLAKLSIQSKDGKNPLLSAENIKLSYDFMTLLRGKLQLGQVLIVEPQLRLVRETDGRLNIDDLFGGQADAAEAGASAADPPKFESSAEIPLLVKHFSLQGGTLLFIDRKLNQHSPYRYRLEKLDVEVDNFSLQQPFLVRLAASLNGSALAMELQYDVNKGVQGLGLHLDQLNLVPFLPYFQNVLPGSLGQGLLSTELQISKQPAGFVTKGQVVVEQLDIKLDLEQSVHWSEIRIALDQDTLYRPSDQVIEVKKLLIDSNGVQAGYQGKILLAEPLQVAGEGSLKILDLREISALIPLELREQVAAYGVAGGFDALMQLQGQPVDLEVIQEATIEIIDLQASIGDLRPALNGKFKYSAGRVQGEQLKIDLNGQLLVVDLDAKKNISSAPYLQLMIAGERFDLDALFPRQKEISPSVAAAKADKLRVDKADKRLAGQAKTNQNEPLILPVDGRVRVQFSQILYQGLQLQKVQGEALLHDGTVSLESLTAGLAGGVVTLSAEAELAEARIPLRGHLRVDGVDLTALTDDLFPEAQGSVKGTLIAESSFSGHGGTDDILATLNAEGNFDLKDGEIKGSPFLAELSRFLTNPELKVLSFRRLHGTYRLKNRQGTIDAQLESRRVVFAPQGSFSLDGPLNLSLGTRISPEFMAKSGVGGKGVELLKDEKGWTLLPLMVKGSYSRPRISLDSRGIKEQLQKGVVDKLGRQLHKKLGGADEDQLDQQMQKLLDGALKKLFGN